MPSVPRYAALLDPDRDCCRDNGHAGVSREGDLDSVCQSQHEPVRGLRNRGANQLTIRAVESFAESEELSACARPPDREVRPANLTVRGQNDITGRPHPELPLEADVQPEPVHARYER